MKLAFVSLIVIGLLGCGGGGSEGNIAINPIGSDVLSYERDKGKITSITLEENSTLTGVRLVIGGESSDGYIFEIISDNHNLIPPENVQITGEGKFRDLAITPEPNQTGIANLSGQAVNTELGITISATLKVTVVAQVLVENKHCILNASTLSCTLN